MNKTEKSRSKAQVTRTILIALLVAVLALSLMVCFGGCKKKNKAEDKTTEPVVTEAITEAATEELTAEETAEPVIEPDELPAPAMPHSSEIFFKRVDAGEELQYTNPLTGLAATKDVSNNRPIAVMINNIEYAMPQVGISKADVLYECLAEGGITRLVMVTCDYDAIETIGSVRSSREYYIDFAKNHDAIYVHAGGSDEAYSQIHSRAIDHLDGVRTDSRTGINVSGQVFYRDQDRLATMAYEHTLMTSGQRILDGIATMGYRTTLNEGFTDPMLPVDWGWSVALNGDDAKHIKIPYRGSAHTTEYEYNPKACNYSRFQFNHQEHIDGATGNQLTFKNILLLEMTHSSKGDDKGRLNVYTTGSGSGLYITCGKMIPITWSKDTVDSALVLKDSGGNPLVINRGKTAINIVDSGLWSSVTYN